MSHLTKNQYDYCHFKLYAQLDNLKRFDMMTTITTFSLATACCYIDDDRHLQDIISFMSFEQQKGFKSLISTIQEMPPTPEFVVEVQQMIMSVFKDFEVTISVLATVADILGVTFSDDLTGQEESKHKFEENSGEQPELIPIFSKEGLAIEMKHRKPKDMPKLKELKALGPNKTLYYAQRNTVKQLSSLATSFPNFQPVIAQVNAACQVSLLTKTPLSLPVINLQGHPGIGKTQFVNALAKTLSLEFFTINAAAMTGRFELCGGNPQYGDADVGAIGRIMCFEAKSASPIILIDELCMAKDNHQESIIQPLYSFFEREQRKCFKENFLNIELDLSGAIIFTTTNDFESLKPALKSRVVNIDIEAPTPNQMQAIVQSIYEQCLVDMKLESYFSNKLSAKLLSALCHLPPRNVSEQLRLAIGKACVQANDKDLVILKLSDLNMLDNDNEPNQNHPNKVH
ncbi:AAA family ATPase [Thalassotalea sp. SU-HH00458]|uniref:AAA family ATPase n=1 Tax=Thalassotalea sp. SU-HH00458 TaxID=3127657 RepID=UPI0031087A65